jgi:N-acetylglucosamine malate deacetylase 2
MTPGFLLEHPILIIVAHPDDETIGLGGQFHFLDNLSTIHVTDGVVRGAAAREEHAAIRRRELHAAMDLAGVPAERRLELGAEDQGSAFRMAELTRRLALLVEQIRPRIAITHPYEGGHPDHDSCAFLVQHAVSFLEARSLPVPRRFEFASYHNGTPHSDTPSLRTGEFLSDEAVETSVLSDEARRRKQRLLDCFVSQRDMLKNFRVDVEKFRQAPMYDFSRAPHEGTLFYDPQGWGVTAREWRDLASKALLDLDLLPAHEPG